MKGYGVSLRKLLQLGMSEPEFCGDLVYGVRKIVGKSNFSEQFRKLVDLCGGVGCGPCIVRQTACLVVDPVVVGGCASLFGCTAVVWASDSMIASSWGFDGWVGA